MDPLAEQLDSKLHEWKPDTADQVRRLVLEIIECADRNVLDIARSRSVELKVLVLIDRNVIE